ncbi:hypothetical protein SDC9_177293 [bioreactor metagenome]|uniref:Uncharacterized protein n=1 Tax=bioreactor metagenome TaxID=1076179 RepID=A0A645GU37_9ZZZZ
MMTFQYTGMPYNLLPEIVDMLCSVNIDKDKSQQALATLITINFNGVLLDNAALLEFSNTFRNRRYRQTNLFAYFRGRGAPVSF